MQRKSLPTTFRWTSSGKKGKEKKEKKAVYRYVTDNGRTACKPLYWIYNILPLYIKVKMLLLLLPSEYVYPVSHRLSGALFFKERETGKEKRVPRVVVRIYTVPSEMNITGSETYAGKELRSTAGSEEIYGKKKAVLPTAAGGRRNCGMRAGKSSPEKRGSFRWVARPGKYADVGKSMRGNDWRYTVDIPSISTYFLYLL